MTRRHVARLGELTDDESATVGRMAARLAAFVDRMVEVRNLRQFEEFIAREL